MADEQPAKNPAAVALGKLGASKGGIACAAARTQRERSEACSKAVKARWEQERVVRERREKRRLARAAKRNATT